MVAVAKIRLEVWLGLALLSLAGMTNDKVACRHSFETNRFRRTYLWRKGEAYILPIRQGDLVINYLSR